MMVNEHIRRLPMVDKHSRLVGIVSERDLFHALPSDATSLSIWEMNYLISKVTVDKLMTRKVFAITEDTPLKDAARIMADKKIGGHIVSLGTFLGENRENRKVTLKVYGVDAHSLRDAVEPFVEQIVDVRESMLA